MEIRPAEADDLPAILALATAALGWAPGEPHEELFRWKHRQGPFGPSPAWVAVVDGTLVGFRTFLPWEFATPGTPTGAPPVRAVRAVDTATHPDHQGRGIFRALTTLAVEEVAADGVRFVFNTPNDQSRPGYLKMGWQQVGRVEVGVRVGGPASARRLLAARAPAAKWSVRNRIGLPAADVLGDADEVDRWLAGPQGLRAGWPGTGGRAALATARTGRFLRWRYAAAPLDYRVLPADDADVAGSGFVVFRLRRRGPALEATVCDLLLPPGAGRADAAALVARLRRVARADHAIAVRAPGRGWVGTGLVPLPGQGPVLTWRGLVPGDTTGAHLADWSLGLGDIELF